MTIGAANSPKTVRLWQNPQRRSWRELTWHMIRNRGKKGEFLMHNRKEKTMNLPDKSSIILWDKWLKATGVDAGYGYRVPDKVWNAAWHGNWPDDEGTIRWILEKYLDVETANAHGYFELIIFLRQQGEEALNTAKNKAECQRQI